MGLFTLFALLVLTITGNAQSGPAVRCRGRAHRRPGLHLRNHHRDLKHGSSRFHTWSGKAARPRTSEEEKLALAQIAEDYQRIQLINNRMMSGAMSRPVPNFNDIAEATAEIKRRANRMRDNLRLPVPEKSEAVKATLSPSSKRRHANESCPTRSRSFNHEFH